MFKFPTKEKEEGVKEFELLDSGEYKFAIRDAQEQVSKKGNEMLKLTLVITKEDKEYWVYDYLLAMDFHVTRISDFLGSVGLADCFEDGKLDVNDIIGRNGMAEIMQDSYVNDNGATVDSNKVSKYIHAHLPSQNDELFDDDIPF